MIKIVTWLFAQSGQSCVLIGLAALLHYSTDNDSQHTMTTVLRNTSYLFIMTCKSQVVHCAVQLESCQKLIKSSQDISRSVLELTVDRVKHHHADCENNNL